MFVILLLLSFLIYMLHSYISDLHVPFGLISQVKLSVLFVNGVHIY